MIYLALLKGEVNMLSKPIDLGNFSLAKYGWSCYESSTHLEAGFYIINLSVLLVESVILIEHFLSQ